MDIIGDKRKMVTPVHCIDSEGPPQQGSGASATTPVYKVVAYCHERQVSDYKFDKSRAVVVATNITRVAEGAEEYHEILAETITVVQIDEVPKVRTTLQAITQIALKMLSAPTAPDGTRMPWPESPQCAMKKCNDLHRYPSDPTSPARTSPPKRQRTTSPAHKAAA